MDTHLITMAFMHAVLEAVHAHDASGIYCTISAKVKADLVEKCVIWGWRPATQVTVQTFTSIHQTSLLQHTTHNYSVNLILCVNTDCLLLAA